MGWQWEEDRDDPVSLVLSLARTLIVQLGAIPALDIFQSSGTKNTLRLRASLLTRISLLNY